MTTQSGKYTPAGWHWKITPEQIEKIKANDRETVNTVYFDNYDKFERIAKGYCRTVRRPDCLPDCLQQIYIDLPVYKYDDINALFLSLKRSFRYACGLPRGVPFQCVLSLDRALFYDESDGKKRTLADTIAAPETVTDTERQENERHALEIIAAQSQLGETGRDVLTAFAFACAAYRGLFAYEFAQSRSR